jgi:hypothetical protein
MNTNAIDPHTIHDEEEKAIKDQLIGSDASERA